MINVFLILNMHFPFAIGRKNRPDIAYNEFLKIFSETYDSAFPEILIKCKTKTLISPWVTKRIQISSETNQKLYEKFLKKSTYDSEKTYKNYKNLLGKNQKLFQKTVL